MASLVWLAPIIIFLNTEMLFAVGYFFRMKCNVPGPISRKLGQVYILIGTTYCCAWLSKYKFDMLSSTIICLLIAICTSLPGIFCILPFYGYNNKYFKYHLYGLMREDEPDFDSVYTNTTKQFIIYGPITFLVVFVLWKYNTISYIVTLIMISAFADTFGELIPNILKTYFDHKNHYYMYWDFINKCYHRKSAEGCLSILIANFSYILYTKYLFCGYSIYFKLICSFILTFIEGISPKGMDNVFLIIAGFVIMYYFQCSD